MDALRALSANVPDWVKRLDELNGQIEKRQHDLASVEETQSGSSARSLRKNKGSTESLKPKDDGDAFPPPLENNTPPPAAGDAEVKPPSSPASDRKSPSFIARQKTEVALAAQKRARATLRKRQKTESMLSGEGALPTYRSRNMILVYYDSYVQSFFEELVRFVSASRNLIRKAKMAAKVAQIKRLAELEMPEEDDDEDDEDGELRPGDGLIAADIRPMRLKSDGLGPAELMLRYRSTRNMGPGMRVGAPGGLPPLSGAAGRGGLAGPAALTGAADSGGDDAYDELDKGLEFVQGMCERAAHQFLRDAECSEEIEKIQARLKQVKEAADREIERSSKENPDGEAAEPDPPKSRSYRPMSMRREPASSNPAKKEKVDLHDEGVQDMG